MRLPAGASFTMLLSFVLPETLMAVALLFVLPAGVRSLPPLDRPHLFGGVIQIDKNLIHIALAPAVRRIVAFDDRVLCLMEVRGGVAVR